MHVRSVDSWDWKNKDSIDQKNVIIIDDQKNCLLQRSFSLLYIIGIHYHYRRIKEEIGLKGINVLSGLHMYFDTPSS